MRQENEERNLGSKEEVSKIEESKDEWLFEALYINCSYSIYHFQREKLQCSLYNFDCTI